MKVLIGIFTIFCSLSCFALTEGDVDMIDSFNIVDSRVLLHDDDWGVNSAKIDPDKLRFKDQPMEITDWKNADPYQWLDIHDWMKQRAIKDKMTDWKSKVRNARNKELVGSVIQCIGICGTYRGLHSSRSEYMSKIKEGDEFYTEKNSYAWLLLTDGSLVRVSPQTSLTLSEINISDKEFLFVVRLNQGHINYRARLKGEFETLDLPESDMGFYPLYVKEANREYFIRKEYKEMDTAQRLVYSIVENPGHNAQYEALNKIANEESELFYGKDTTLFLYAPNISTVVKNANVDLFHATNGKSFIYSSYDNPGVKKTDKREQKISVSFRGYNNKNETSIDPGKWYEMDRMGKNLETTLEYQHAFDASIAFLKRIPTIYLAREFLLRKMHKNVFQKNWESVDFAQKVGYRLWDKEESTEIARRMRYVKNYTRRVETTNIRSTGKLFRNRPVKQFDKSFFAKAMKLHYDALKERFSEKTKLVREMNDTQYYLWTLRYAKKQISTHSRK